jgi:hypothetical protein
MLILLSGIVITLTTYYFRIVAFTTKSRCSIILMLRSLYKRCSLRGTHHMSALIGIQANNAYR